MPRRIAEVLVLMFCLLIVLILIVPQPVWAADASTTTVDFSPLLNQLIDVAVVILTAVAAWGALFIQGLVRKNLGLTIDDKIRTVLEDAIDNGIAYAAAKAKTLTAGAQFDVKNATVKGAADYVIAHAPDALAHFGVDQATLERKIISQLPQPAVPVAS